MAGGTITSGSTGTTAKVGGAGRVGLVVGGRGQQETRRVVMGIRVKEHTMYRRHEGGRKLHQWMGGILILAIVLCASVVPGHARRGGGHGEVCDATTK
jgi:hypothetical protein